MGLKMEKQLHLPLMVSLVAGSRSDAPAGVQNCRSDQAQQELPSAMTDCERKRLSRELANYSRKLKW